MIKINNNNKIEKEIDLKGKLKIHFIKEEFVDILKESYELFKNNEK